MLQVVHFVRKRLLVMRRRFSFANRTISTCTNLENQYKAVTQQALLYVGVFLLVWFFGFLFRVSKKTRNPYLLIPAQILNPLQGFLNFFVYTWPRYAKSKEENPEKSLWWLIKDSIITATKAKIARRRLSDMQIRTMKKRKSILRRTQIRQESQAQCKSIKTTPNECANCPSSDVDAITSDENVDDFVDEGEPLTILQHLQRLDSNQDCEIDEPMTLPHELLIYNDTDGEMDENNNTSSIFLGNDTKSPKYIGEL